MKAKKAMELVGKITSLLRRVLNRTDFSGVDNTSPLFETVEILQDLSDNYSDDKSSKFEKVLDQLPYNKPEALKLADMRPLPVDHANRVVQFLYAKADRATQEKIQLYQINQRFTEEEISEFEALIGTKLSEAVLSLEPNEPTTKLVKELRAGEFHLYGVMESGRMQHIHVMPHPNNNDYGPFTSFVLRREHNKQVLGFQLEDIFEWWKQFPESKYIQWGIDHSFVTPENGDTMNEKDKSVMDVEFETAEKQGRHVLVEVLGPVEGDSPALVGMLLSRALSEQDVAYRLVADSTNQDELKELIQTPDNEIGLRLNSEEKPIYVTIHTQPKAKVTPKKEMGW